MATHNEFRQCAADEFKKDFGRERENWGEIKSGVRGEGMRSKNNRDGER